MTLSISVSVIIPVYNGERFLAEAITSVLDQGMPALELIVIDDGSTDNSASVAQQFGQQVRYFYQPNSGPAAARNQGIEMSQGQIISFLDADDLFPPGKLSFQLGYLQANPDAGVSLGSARLFRSNPHLSPPLSIEFYEDPFIMYLVGCALFRRQLFDEVGNFDPIMRYAEDIDWFLRARDAGTKIIHHPEITLFCRWHAHNMTNQIKPAQHYLAIALKRSLDRRRKLANSFAS